MSPRAPTSVQPPTPIDHMLLDKNTPAPTPTDQHDNKSITASPYVHQAPSVEPPASAEPMQTAMGPGSVTQPSPQSQQQQQQQPPPQQGSISVKKFEVVHSSSATTNLNEIKLESGLLTTTSNNNTNNNNNTRNLNANSSAEAMAQYLKLFKPPKLTVKDMDSYANEDCLRLEVLYDFRVSQAW